MKKEISICHSKERRQYMAPDVTISHVELESVILNASVSLNDNTYNEGGRLEDL